MKIISAILCLCILGASARTAFAQTNYKAKALTHSGEKSKEQSVKLFFSENSFAAVSGKNAAPFKEFNYADIISADYTFSEKPVFSRGEILAAYFFISSFAVALTFLKKKQHWISLRTKDDYVVLHLSRGSYKKIINEFMVRKIPVLNFDEEENNSEERKN